MWLRKLWLGASASLLVLAAAGLFSAVAASNSVNPTNLGEQSAAIDANALKPPECAAVNLTRVVILARGDLPNNRNELIIGASGDDNISGNGGTDCILGGDGDDVLRGGNGQDILVGGPGNDALDGGGGRGDVCYGGGQAGDTFKRCETVIP